MIQDHQGFIWMATNSGLYRYDGYEFKHFQKNNKPNSLPEDFVSSIVEDQQHRLWVSTYNGLALFNKKNYSFTTYHPTKINETTPQSRHIRKIVLADNGLWLASRQGLQYFDFSSKEFHHYRHNPEDPNSIARDNIDTLAIDANGGIWAATWPGGIDYLAAGSSKFTHYTIKTEDNSTLANNVRALFVDSKNQLWLGTESGVFLWPLPRKHIEQPDRPLPVTGLTHKIRVHSFTEDHMGTIWSGTSHGLLRLNTSQKKFDIYQHQPFKKNSLPGNGIYALLIDHSNSFWVSTNMGSARADFSLSGFKQIPANYFNTIAPTSNNEYLSMHLNKQNLLWLSSITQLILLDPISQKVIKKITLKHLEEKGLIDSRIYNIYQQNTDILWLGTRRGLVRLNLKNESIKTISLGKSAHNFVNKIIKGTGNILWLGTGAGLIEYDTTLGVLRKFQRGSNSLSISSISNMLLDSKGNLWLSSDHLGGGLNIVNTITGSIQYYQQNPTNSKSLPSNYIYNIQQDPSGTVWLATSSGLSKAELNDNNFTFHTYSFPTLRSMNIRAIHFDNKGLIWLATSLDYAQFNPKTLQLKPYPIIQGFKSYNIGRDFLIDGNGTLYFVSGQDLIITHSQKASVNQIPPIVAITDISVLNHSLSSDTHPNAAQLEGSVTQPEKLILPWLKTVFSIRFSALHFSDPELNRYAYKLEGFNQDWVQTDSKNRVATYTNLDPGEYQFKVKASNNTGIWNEKGVSFPIIITPPYWQTVWFRALFATIIILSLLAIYFWRTYKLRQAKINLENQVNQRTKELKKAHQDTVAAAQVKSDFLANMSHEIRTPLNAIMGMTHLAQKTPTTDKQKNYLNKINISAKWLLDILNDVLDFTKIESGKIELEYLPFNVNQMLTSVENMTTSLMADKALSLEFTIDQGIPGELIGDSLRLKQVLLNLISNAIKFTQTGTISVHIQQLTNSNNQTRLCFNVIDTGIGLTDQQQENLFSAFNQADNSITRKYGGTGLGLSISKDLIQMMGGTIKIESSIGSGSRFYFNLNFEVAKSLQGELPAAPSLAIKTNFDFSSAKVLLVEDNLINQELMMETLQDQGMHADHANNGEEAISMIEKNSYDLVLMDCQMPVMDGFTATKIIRKNPNFEKLPIIAMTANTTVDSRDRCFACGMNEFIPKPIDWEHFAKVLARWVKPSPKQHKTEDCNPLTLQLPGFELSQTMNLLAGNQEKLIAMLAKFHTQYTSEITNFIEQISTQPLKVSKAWLHALKGSAGNLGATDLYQATVILENKLLSGQYSQPDFNTWHTVFEETMHTLAQLKATTPIIEIKSSIETSTILIKELNSLLDSDGFINDELLKQLQNQIPKNRQSEYNNLLQSIIETDYTQSKALLKKLSTDLSKG